MSGQWTWWDRFACRFSIPIRHMCCHSSEDGSGVTVHSKTFFVRWCKHVS